MLSRLVIAFLPRSKHLNFMVVVTICSDFGASPKIKSLTVSIVSPSICHEEMGPDAMIFVFECWVLSQLFHSPLSLSSRGSLLSAIQVVSSAYLRLLIFLLEILILAYDSSSPAFHMMYFAYKWNKQSDNIQPWYTPLPNFEPVHCSMSSSNCCFLNSIQISQESGKVVWHSHLFKNFPQFVVIHIDKGFSVVNEAKVDVFLELSCFFDDPAGVGNLISGSSAFSKSSLNIWKFTVHIRWSLAWRILSISLLVCEMSVVVQ